MTLRDRDRWMAHVCADALLSSGAKLAAVRIALHFNIKTGRCNPTYQRLASGTACKVSAIAKQLKQLEERRYLKREGSKGRFSNSYSLLFPTNATADENTQLADLETSDPFTGLTSDRDTRLKRSNQRPQSTVTGDGEKIEPCTAVHTNREESLNRETNREGDITAGQLALLPSVPLKASGFKAWYAMYPRKAAPKDAEQAYDKTMKAGEVTESVLFERTRAFRNHWEERIQKKPSDRKFIPEPATWLRKGRWDDDLTFAVVTDSLSSDKMHLPINEFQKFAKG